jgi:phage recombination protein Bet
MTNLPAVKQAGISTIPVSDDGIANFLCTPEGVETVRNTIAPDLTMKEFALFIGLCKRMGADPFAKDIYPVKYKDRFSTPVNYHFYIKKAQSQKDYLNHVAKEVYEGDDFHDSMEIGENGELIRNFKHTPAKIKDRGALLGAYCFVWTRRQPQPYYVWLDFKAVNQGNAKWNTMPGWMTRKCTIAACFREAFAGEFRGAYIEEELPSHTTAEISGNAGMVVSVQEATKKPKTSKKAKPKPAPKPEPVVTKEEKPAEPTPEPEEAPEKEEPEAKANTIPLTMESVEGWVDSMEFVTPMARKILKKNSNGDPAEFVRMAVEQYSDKDGFVNPPWEV